MANQAQDGPLVWIDCEMTGLDLKKDKIIEIACYVTDGSLNLLEQNGFEEVINCPKEILDSMDAWCTEHHGQSGLTAKVLASVASTREVETRLLHYLKNSVGITKQRTAILAGNSIHADKEFLRKEMPELLNFLHYRIIDVSTVKELAKRRNPAVFEGSPKKLAAHTAKSDILESIKELQYYYDTWLTPGHQV
ncbi:ribonuclease H-like domain-containing protein [Lipomyces japonicus]|uniref:ribonuclease H-like domain-containing protein n=1 Tax=Lipomyces japonicus TaxID=56871 RepID=UPI0034CEED90